MADKNSLIPKFFVYLLIIPAVIMIIGIFVNVQVVGIAYFVALLISVAFLIIDKNYGKMLTNYKITFALTDFLNLIAVAAILYYEFSKITLVLNIFLFALIVIEVAMLILDVFFAKNKNISKYAGVITDIVRTGAMVSIVAYFYKVSTFWFAIVAVSFALISFVIKCVLTTKQTKLDAKVEDNEKSQREEIEDRIRSAGEGEGEIE